MASTGARVEELGLRYLRIQWDQSRRRLDTILQERFGWTSLALTGAAEPVDTTVHGPRLNCAAPRPPARASIPAPRSPRLNPRARTVAEAFDSGWRPVRTRRALLTDRAHATRQGLACGDVHGRPGEPAAWAEFERCAESARARLARTQD